MRCLPRQLLACAIALLPLAGFGHSQKPAVREMAAAASTWLQSLNEEQRQQAVFPLNDNERENWHYVPRDRKGLPLKDMTAVQRDLARKLIAAGLSQRGQLQMDEIIALENVLHEMEGAARRNPELYYFSVFGSPAAEGNWGWRAEGHHLAINFTIVAGDKISVTPLFFGSNPAEVRIDHAQKGNRALAQEEDSGRALIKSLTNEQRQVALISAKAPFEIITGNDRQVKADAPAGLVYDSMSAAQQEQLRALVQVYAGRLRAEVAEVEMQKIALDWSHVYFTWAGGLERGDGHYYRIQGPSFVIEYDNVQNDANHIHTTWRNFDGDFGRDLLREHYEQAHRR